MQKLPYPHQMLFGLPFFNGTLFECVAQLEQWIEKEQGLLSVATPNPEQIVQAQHSKVFAQDLAQFDYYLPDGHGIILASYIHKTPLRQRIAGIDVVEQLARFAVKHDWKMVIVGGRDYQNAQLLIDDKKFAITIGQGPTEKSPVVWLEGYGKVAQMSEEELRAADEEVMAMIRQIQPQIVFVALGAPFQEAWIIRNKLQLIKYDVRVAMVVGGAIDTLTGKISRAPKIMRNLGFEWLFRLFQQPWRWRRQLRLV